jgi:DNA-binding PucR family transcriptional regulator
VTVLTGVMPDPDDVGISDLRAAARRTGLCLLVGEYGGRLLIVVGGSGAPATAIEQAGKAFPPGPVAVGPTVSELTEVVEPIAEALAALSAVAGWPDAPRPVASADLLAERAVLGDAVARQRLRTEVYEPLRDAGGDLLLTASTYLEAGAAVESTARRLFLHPNTVRYRLRKIADVTRRDITAARDAQVVRLALVIGRSA